MHGRFAGARTAALQCPGGEIGVVVAERYRLRLLGLMRLEAEEIEPLLIPRCRSIHMHVMRTPIDLVWLTVDGGSAQVLAVEAGLAVGRSARAPRGGVARDSIAALELLSGEARRLALTPGAKVTLAS